VIGPVARFIMSLDEPIPEIEDLEGNSNGTLSD
jgi:hypothetical protein